MSDWHGYRVGDPKFGLSLQIGTLPDRKSVCLYVLQQDDNTASIQVLAHFRSAEAAEVAQNLLDVLQGMRVIDDSGEFPKVN